MRHGLLDGLSIQHQYFHYSLTSQCLWKNKIQKNQRPFLATFKNNMIDTIVLLLHSEAFHVQDPDKFIPSACWVFAQNKANLPGITSKQNPSKRELRKGLYKPRLTLAYRPNIYGKQEVILKIELSLPKLLLGNNFEELRYKDFLPTVEKLVTILKQMGVVTTTAAIASAPVCTIHYSKNIPLTDGATPRFFINKLKEANIKLSLDTNQTDYRNEGHSYRWHCNSYEVIFYDKIKDLEKARTSNKRAVEKDSDLQLPIAEKLKNKKKFEVLRMEVRLNKRKKMKLLFSKLGIKNDLTFKKLFKPAISKKILLHYMDELESKRPTLLDYKTSNGQDGKALLADLMFHNPELGPKKILQLYGLKHALDIMNPRELRAMFANHSTRTWYRLIAEANQIRLPETHKPFGVIRKCLEAFESLRFKKI